MGVMFFMCLLVVVVPFSGWLSGHFKFDSRAVKYLAVGDVALIVWLSVDFYRFYVDVLVAYLRRGHGECLSVVEMYLG